MQLLAEASKEALSALNAHKAAWDDFSKIDRQTRWLLKNTRNDSDGKKTFTIPIKGQSFHKKQFTDYCFEGIRFDQCYFEECDFSSGHFSLSDFYQSTFKKCTFKSTTFHFTHFNHCDIQDCSFYQSIWNESNLQADKNITRSDFSETQWTGNQHCQGSFIDCTFAKATFEQNLLNGGILSNCDFCNTKFRRCDLSNVIWTKCLINAETDFGFSNLNSDLITKDTSETTRYALPLRKSFFNWRMVRAIGNFPILGFSWLVFLSSLLVINTIGAINGLDPPLLNGMEDIPIPHDALWILISSLLLALGSTIYAIWCPSNIKSFSESQWVFEHKHPRMEYLVEALQRPVLQFISVISLSTGSIIGLCLVVGRVLDALAHIKSFS